MLMIEVTICNNNWTDKCNGNVCYAKFPWVIIGPLRFQHFRAFSENLRVALLVQHYKSF